VGERDEAGVPTAAASQAAVEGLFIDLGERQPEDVALLKEGTGAMTDEIHTAIDRWRKTLGIDTAGDVVPVVLLYRQRNRKSASDKK
jgi:predicted exporter